MLCLPMQYLNGNCPVTERYREPCKEYCACMARSLSQRQYLASCIYKSRERDGECIKFFWPADS